jgi:hypothetical protein
MKRPIHQHGLGPILEVLFFFFLDADGTFKDFFWAPFFGGLNLLGNFSLLKKKEKTLHQQGAGSV